MFAAALRFGGALTCEEEQGSSCKGSTSEAMNSIAVLLLNACNNAFTTSTCNTKNEECTWSADSLCPDRPASWTVKLDAKVRSTILTTMFQKNQTQAVNHRRRDHVLLLVIMVSHRSSQSCRNCQLPCRPWYPEDGYLLIRLVRGYLQAFIVSQLRHLSGLVLHCKLVLFPGSSNWSFTFAPPQTLENASLSIEKWKAAVI